MQHNGCSTIMDGINHAQVQATNDFSMVSKWSAASKGYILDRFLQYFVKKRQYRTSLIHLGYYTRAEVMHKLLERVVNFLHTVNVSQFQVISCGCGFDTTFWRLSESKLLGTDSVFIEIDFPEVIKKKVFLIQQSKVLQSFIWEKSNEFHHPDIYKMNSNYFLFAADLSNVNIIEDLLMKINTDFGIPVIFLSECAVTYMKTAKSDELIRWMSNKFSNCCLLNYEQIHPNDNFGQAMVRHFERINSPLYSISTYPDCESHKRRYKFLGFDSSVSASEWDAIKLLTTVEEHKQALTREQFDELEEFHLKCVHYVIAVAGNNIFTDFTKALSFDALFYSSDSRNILLWDRKDLQLQLYGHSSCLLSRNSTLLFGGFHQHRRSSSVWIVNESSLEKMLFADNHRREEVHFDMVHGCCCNFKLKDKSYVCLYGGRTSPNKVWNNGEVAVVEVQEKTLKWNAMRCANKPPLRYRSSMVCFAEVDIATFFVFAGRDPDLNVALCDLWQLTLKLGANNTVEGEWKSLEPKVGPRPCSRMSHSAAASHGEEAMYVTCGLGTESLSVLNDIWKWSRTEYRWHLIQPKSGNLLPRYGHTSHIVDDQLYLVGGVNTCPGLQPGVAVFNLTSLALVEYALQEDIITPGWFFNHSSEVMEENGKYVIVIYGGGGNLFSFGTYLNDNLLRINLPVSQIS